MEKFVVYVVIDLEWDSILVEWKVEIFCNFFIRKNEIIKKLKARIRSQILKNTKIICNTSVDNSSDTGIGGKKFYQKFKLT